MMNDEVVRMKEELDSLRVIRDRQDKEIQSLHKRNQDMQVRLEHSEAINNELHGKIRFLEGQVDAYQYCMNCRR